MSIFDSFRDRLDQRLKDLEDTSKDEMSQFDSELAKAKAMDDPSLSKAERDKYRFKRISIVDPNLTPSVGDTGFGIYRSKASHISNKTLREMSLRDPLITSIFQTRIQQVARFAHPQESRYDAGFKIQPRDPSVVIKPGSVEEQEIAVITDFIRNCGSNEDRAPDSKMDFDTFLRLVVRDRLTFGACAIETLRNNLGAITAFLPAPTETIYYSNKQLPPDVINGAIESQQQGFQQLGATQNLTPVEPARERLQNEGDESEEYEFVQVINGKIVEAFTRKEMLYKLGNPQNIIENSGYCIGELELATMTITTHLQAENYNRLFFTHGFASRGLIHIKGDVTPATLQAFRSQWHAQVSGNANSWRTPVIAGVDEINWIPLSATNRDMEYSVYVDHIIRTLCAIFSISPLEIGFDYLTKGPSGGGLGTEDNEVKIEQSQVRGLKPLLTWIETIINEDIFSNVDEVLASKYKFCFVGLDIESKLEEIERQQAEIGFRSTINQIRTEVGADPVLGGDVILNPAYLEVLASYFKVGEVREGILGMKGDAQNPEYNYIRDPLYFQNLMAITGQLANPDGEEDEEEGGPGDDAPPQEEPEEEDAPDDEEDAKDKKKAKSATKKDKKGKNDKPPKKDKKMKKSDWMVKPPVNPEVLAKAAALGRHPTYIAHKNAKAVAMDKALEEVRAEFHKNYKASEVKLIKEMLTAVKDDLRDENGGNKETEKDKPST